MASKRVLVVDDEAAIREVLQQVLEIEGYSVQCAVNGSDGLSRLRNMPKPCAILLDLMMPIMNGWQFMESLGQDISLKGVPVIVITAFTDRTQPIQASKVLKKPIDVDYLLDTIKSCCG